MNADNKLFSQRFERGFKAVLIRCLDEHRQHINNATGFIRREQGKLWLYTCWHVVTGYDRNDLKVGNKLPNRVFLEIAMQDAQERQPGVEAVGGLQSLVVPLYDTTTKPRTALWYQDKRHVPHADLNAVKLFIPFWHDAVKLPLPDGARTSTVQIIEENEFFPANTLLTVGDKLYVVGFPYGYSSVGAQQPTPVVLTRFVAATRIGGRNQEILLESAGAPGMSGGPVLVERDSGIHLIGMYTGLLYPDHATQSNEKVTALGTCSNMSLCLWGHLPFVQTPCEN
jgi:hypothetical protein